MSEKAMTRKDGSFSLDKWRENPVLNILRGVSIVGIPLFLIGGYPMLQQKLWLHLIFNVVGYLSIIIITYFPVPFHARSVITLVLLYGFGITVILEVGIHGDARIFLLVFILFAFMAFGRKAAFTAAGFSLLTIVIIGWAFFSGIMSMSNPEAKWYPLITWITDTAIFMGIIAFCMAGLGTLLRWFASSRIKVREMVADRMLSRVMMPFTFREHKVNMVEWQNEYSDMQMLSIDVNISPRQCIQPDLPEQITYVLDKTGLKPEYLNIEVTESILIKNLDFSVLVLQNLHKIGVRIQLDDFCADYFSLYFLHKFHVDSIKTDRSFICKMKSKAGDSGIIRAIVTLAEELGVDTIAEGIETAEQMKYLKMMKCRYGQGFFFSNPWISGI